MRKRFKTREEMIQVVQKVEEDEIKRKKLIDAITDVFDESLEGLYKEMKLKSNDDYLAETDVVDCVEDMRKKLSELSLKALELVDSKKDKFGNFWVRDFIWSWGYSEDGE